MCSCGFKTKKFYYLIAKTSQYANKSLLTVYKL